MKRHLTLLALAGLALALTPVTAWATDVHELAGGSGAATSDPSDPRLAPALGDGSELAPCVLVGRTDIVRAIGAPVATGTEVVAELAAQGAGSIKAQYCVYGTEVVVGRLPLGSAGRSFFSKYRKSLASAPGFRQVSGVGDEAFTAKGQLNVRRGKTGLIIDVSGTRRSALSELQAEKALAAVALSRL